jgi:hypothetical protein
MFFLLPTSVFLVLSVVVRDMMVFRKPNLVNRENSLRLRWQNVRKSFRSGVSHKLAIYDSPRPISPYLRIALTASQSFRMMVACSPSSLPMNRCVVPSGVIRSNSPKRVLARTSIRIRCLLTSITPLSRRRKAVMADD